MPIPCLSLDSQPEAVGQPPGLCPGLPLGFCRGCGTMPRKTAWAYPACPGVPVPSVRNISAQARRKVRGGVLLSSGHMGGACMFLPPCPLTDIKQAHPAYPFCSFFIPVSHRKGTGGQIPRPIPAKCTGKKGNSGKSENPRISCICGHKPEMHSPAF